MCIRDRRCRYITKRERKLIMAKKKKNIPQYGTVTRKGVLYYRTRILDADGKQVSLYGTTCAELYDKRCV